MVQILSEINLRMASELEERFLARPTSSTLPFRWTQVKKKGPLQTPKPLIFFLFPISENVDVEILQRGNFEKKLFLRFVMGLFSPGPEVFSRYL